MNQPSAITPNTAPGKVQAMMIMTLINGVLNILTALGLTAIVVLSTLGIGLICVPLTLLPAALGIYEIIAASRLLSTPARQMPNPQVLAILEICAVLFGNIISLAVGVINLVFYNDPEVRPYLDSLPV